MRLRVTPFIALVAAVTVMMPALAGTAPAETTRPSVQVKLVNRGADPRSLVRLAPIPEPQSVVLTLGTEITQSGVSSQHIGPLNIQTVVSFAPTSTAANGTIHAPYTYGAFQLLDSSIGPPEALTAIRDGFRQFQGFGGQLTLSSTGAVISNTFSIPPAVDPNVRSLLQQLSGQSNQLGVPLPSQAIGIGARWQATTHLFVSGLSLTQTYEYTLRSRAGTRLGIDVRYTQTAANQRVRLPGVPGNASVTVAGYRITGSGLTVADLSHLASVSGHVTAEGVQRFRIQRGRRSGTLDQELRLSVDVSGG